ncbi:protein-tyrosine-phosphatase [Croceimicrobium sp.]|uniref:protein-tyrosine-phosphatase n=1 Tax=Croceimicrobium sp. TaxID=2828340 RepID=UPI003BADB8D9
MFSYLNNYINRLDLKNIPQDRLERLQPLVQYVQENQADLSLVFICTHNSRRSQFAQLWAQVAAFHFGIDLASYSGGTEATACNPCTLAAMERAGFDLYSDAVMDPNPVYRVAFAEKEPPIMLHSKLYDDPENPSANFAAVMTCSDADENCPFIPGTKARIALNYEDPKAFDGTDQETAAYDERCLQIATEMFYVFSAIEHGY